MNKLEVIRIILQYVEANEIDKANILLKEKHRELMQSKARGVRKEIAEIVKTMAAIDKELMLYKLRHAHLEQICPNGIFIEMKSYVKLLEDERKSLAKQKREMAKM
ncbi:hypothetical protein [Metasolibacillus meyeri]|uniref:hypothetical protein n=1 Tax=Metasolibacillus meyeri TaxID=1071052 RepID=UPI000D309B4C|nr:hypothetical protein [Metasolibacillus meyeri]